VRVDLVDPEPDDITAAVTKLLNGHNKSEIARNMDVSRETIYRWERGEAHPDILELNTLARLTGNEVGIKINQSEADKNLEQQLADLRQSFAVFHAGRESILQIVEDMHPDDPRVQERVKQVRELMRRTAL
jgi:transcriptional regulator with XRE-family HTH domain